MREVKLKEIKPGMVIHCKTQEEAIALCLNTDIPFRFIDYWDCYKEQTCYCHNEYSNAYGDIKTYKCEYTITEFEDLIIDDGMEEEQVENENPDKPYITCTLVDGTVLDFDKKCSEMNEFGANYDMIIFRMTNFNMNKRLELAAIPKSRIIMINFVHTPEMIDKLMKED